MNNSVYIALIGLGCAVPLRAQCRPPTGSHEARLLALYSVPVVFTADLASASLAPGEVRLTGEGVYVPTASASLQHTEYCYTGKAEHTGLTPFFGRPRLAIGLPGGTGIEASYLPSVTIAGATPNIASGAVWVARHVRENLLLTFRLHGTKGAIRGAITCPNSALQQSDAQAPCYGTRQSDDEFRPDMFGSELVASFTPQNRNSRVRLSGGLGTNMLRPRFRVGFSDLVGGTDHTRISVNETRVTGFLGAVVKAGSRCDGATEGFASFGDAVTVRVMFGCSIHR